MKQAHFFLLAALIPHYATAADRAPALPPPTAVQNTPEAKETVQPLEENEGQLQKEFTAPEPGKNVHVRIYKRPSGAVVEEYSIHGRVFMIRVKPASGTPAYYLYDSNGDGIFERRLPGGYKYITPPAWVIKRF